MNEIKVQVKGMSCSHCKARVEENLKRIEGLTKVEASIENQYVILTGDNIDLNQVKKVIENIGYIYNGILK